MASSSDPWMRELNDASKLVDEVSDMVSQRSSLPLSGSQMQRHMSTARRKMTILRTKLETLQSLLSKLPGNQRITEREINRRQDMLNKLSVKAGEVAPTLNMSMSADRDSLFGLDRNRGDIMKIANDLDNHDLVGFQRQIIKEQDEDLAQLEETVVSTKHIALAVNEELKLQTRLLDNLDEHVDSTDSHLLRVRRKLAALNRKTKGGCSCLILMLIAIVILIILICLLIKYLINPRVKF